MIANGCDRRAMASHVIVEGVATALEAGANGGAGARWRPPATGARQTTANGARFGGTAYLAKEDRPNDEGAVALANAVGGRRSRGGGVGGRQHADGTVPVETDLAFAGSARDTVEPYNPRSGGDGLLSTGGAVGKTFASVVLHGIAKIRWAVGGGVLIVPTGDRCGVVGAGRLSLGVVAVVRWWGGLWLATLLKPTPFGVDASKSGVDAPSVVGARRGGHGG